MNENRQPQTCSRCGATVAPGAPKGLCPRCLMAINLATQTEVSGDDVGPNGTQVVKPPSVPALSPEAIAATPPPAADEPILVEAHGRVKAPGVGQ